MQTLAKYIKQCYNPKHFAEFCEINYDSESDVPSHVTQLVQDGILIVHILDNKYAHQPLKLTFFLMRDIEYVCVGNSYIVKKVFKPLEWYNTDGTASFVETSEPLYRRLLPTNMDNLETVDVVRIISSIIIEYRKATTVKLEDGQELRKKLVYIEYGVFSGKTLFSIAPLVHLAFGVDVNEIASSYHTNIERHQMTTSKFSAKYLPALKYQFALIDADHSSEAVVKDFDALFEHIEVGGYIFLHDTYPCLGWLLEPKFCNDCYKAPIKIKEKYGEKIELLTLPLNPGLTIVRKI